MLTRTREKPYEVQLPQDVHAALECSHQPAQVTLPPILTLTSAQRTTVPEVWHSGTIPEIPEKPVPE